MCIMARKFLFSGWGLLFCSVIVALSATLLCRNWTRAFFQAAPTSDKRAQVQSLYEQYKKEFPQVLDIEPKLAMEMSRKLRVLFVDDREEAEQRVSMLPGAVPARVYLQDPTKYPADIVIGYCTISYRSGVLAQKLQAQGVTMYNLKGGMLAWLHDGGKIYDAAGETRQIHVFQPEFDLIPDGYHAIW